MSELVAAADVVPRAMRMIWRDRIPVGTLSVIAGPPGIGKSSLIALLVADLSRSGTVLISNAEDDLESVTRPRLDAAGALLERVHLVPPDSAPVLPAEHNTLREWIRETGAICAILDPIAAHFQPERRVHDRGSLRRLVGLARASGCAIIGVHHTTKDFEIGGPNAGLLGTARAVYVYGYDPADEDNRALSCVKINGVDAPPALIFAHETIEYERADGKVIEAGRLRQLRQTNANAQARRGRRHEGRDDECYAWLSVYLAGGEDCARPSNDIREQGAAMGYGWQTLRRAKVTLEVENVRVGVKGRTGGGYWAWRLPDEHPLREPAEPEPEPEPVA